jgi:hypothetical protein
MKQYVLPIVFIIIMLCSCTRSLYPITEDQKEMVFKKELLGQWKDKEGASYFIDTLEASGTKIYKVVLIDNNNKSQSPGNNFSDTNYFLASLVNIKGKFFMDCTADIEQPAFKKMGESATNSLLPTHIIIRIFSIEQNSIELAFIDQDNLFALLRQKKISIRHELIDKDDILLTEKSKMLQQKLTELEKFSSVYKDKSQLTRIR